MEKQIVMKERDMEKVTSAQKVAKVLGQILTYTFLGIMALIVLFPFYWMIISSLKSIEEYRLNVPTFLPGSTVVNGNGEIIKYDVMWGNYASAFTAANLGQFFINTLYVGIVSTVLSLIVTVLTAFVFARLEFKGKNMLFAGLLATMMIPGEMFTISNYQTVVMLGCHLKSPKQ
jgi:multiple sugar transport system permease protein